VKRVALAEVLVLLTIVVTMAAAGALFYRLVKPAPRTVVVTCVSTREATTCATQPLQVKK
jgi:hypothetical protein